MRSLKHLIAPGLLLGSALALASGCSVDPPGAPEIPLGEGDVRTQLRTVVSIGNSLTAGFQNSGLAVTGQLASFPNHLARMSGSNPLSASLPLYLQMPLIVVPGDPLTTQQTGIGTTVINGVPQSALFVDGTTFGIVTTPLNPANIPAMLANATYPLPYDNLGVPGAYVGDAAVTTDATNSIKAGNLFFDFILRNSSLPPFDTTQLSQLEAHFTRETIVGADPDTGAPIYDLQVPPIVTLWLGGNDLLLGTATGNPVVGQNVTSVADFEASFVDICNRISDFAPDAQVAVGNTQTLLPVFTTVPTGTMVGGNFVAWNTDEPNVQFVLLNALAQLDPPLGPDYLPGGSASIPGTLTLTQAEFTSVVAVADGYNAVIERECSSRGWAYVDVNTEFGALPGNPQDPNSYTQLNRLFAWFDRTGDMVPEQNQYSAFTLDGVHPSEKGYARIANLFASALNATYGTTYGPPANENVPNVAGFEQVPAAGRGHAVEAFAGISFSESATRVLRSGYGLED